MRRIVITGPQPVDMLDLVGRPSQIHWREVWMTFAAAVLLAVALGVTAYRSGIKRGADATRTTPVTPKESTGSLEAQASDAGYARAQLEEKTCGELQSH